MVEGNEGKGPWLSYEDVREIDDLTGRTLSTLLGKYRLQDDDLTPEQRSRLQDEVRAAVTTKTIGEKIVALINYKVKLGKEGKVPAELIDEERYIATRLLTDPGVSRYIGPVRTLEEARRLLRDGYRKAEQELYEEFSKLKGTIIKEQFPEPPKTAVPPKMEIVSLIGLSAPFVLFLAVFNGFGNNVFSGATVFGGSLMFLQIVSAIAIAAFLFMIFRKKKSEPE